VLVDVALRSKEGVARRDLLQGKGPQRPAIWGGKDIRDHLHVLRGINVSKSTRRGGRKKEGENFDQSKH